MGIKVRDSVVCLVRGPGSPSETFPFPFTCGHLMECPCFWQGSQPSGEVPPVGAQEAPSICMGSIARVERYSSNIFGENPVPDGDYQLRLQWK